MRVKQSLLHGKSEYLLVSLLLVCIAIVGVAFSMRDGDAFDPAKREVLLRGIGHEVLLQWGDSTSRVLPVKRIGKNEYQVSFENDLGFQPDSLVNITRRWLARDTEVSGYVVNVLRCESPGVVYGFAVSRDQKDDIISCLGRRQPRTCYVINIKFEPTKSNTAKNGVILGSMALLALGGYVLLRPGIRKIVATGQTVSPKNEVKFNSKEFTQDGTAISSNVVEEDNLTVLPGQETQMIRLGQLLFDAQNRKLLINEKAIELTGTEARVLQILAMSPNKMIERSRLQKEIWEDAGVIVGRSLDMFISKLRKKLEVAPDIRIVVVRGKGYRLEL